MTSLKQFLGKKLDYWKPVSDRKYFYFRIKLTTDVFAYNNVGGPPAGDTSTPPNGQGYMALDATTKETINKVQVPVIGTPKKTFWMSITPTPVPEHWAEAVAQFKKYLCPSFDVQWDIRLSFVPTKTLLAGRLKNNLAQIPSPVNESFVHPRYITQANIPQTHPTRVLIVVERSLVNNPATMDQSGYIPFGDGGAEQISNDDDWRQYLKQKDPRLVWWKIIDMNTPLRQQGVTEVTSGDTLPDFLKGGATVVQSGLKDLIVSTPTFRCNASASDVQFGTIPIVNAANTISFFQDSENYVELTGASLPRARQPIFYRVFDITNAPRWFAPYDTLNPPNDANQKLNGYVYSKCEKCLVGMHTYLFPDIDRLDAGFESTRNYTSDPEVDAVGNGGWADEVQWQGKTIQPY